MPKPVRTIRSSRGKKVNIYSRKTKESRRVQRKKWLRTPAGRKYLKKQRLRRGRIKRGTIRVNRQRSAALKAAKKYQRNKKNLKVRKYRGPKYTIRY